ncbi:hypothetical protein OTK49_26660 [Vibrio coralliirubri]|uniref:hypothetical protein n=1 Tax=Vibrio coralliirubri TaxID=1516159 RepID=UPI002284B2F8|nr:hypothetical protein [Vibrio coralliirubri]MCY9866123.1 hypothetical protein [Vibrio coralliirubri]
MEKNVKMTKKIIPALLLALSFSSPVSASSKVNSILPSGKTMVMENLEAWKFGESLDELNSMVMMPSFNPYIKDRKGSTALDYAVINKVKPIEYHLKKEKYKYQYRTASKMKYSDFFSDDLKIGLLKAIAAGALPAVKEFLVKHPDFDLNFELGAGITPLAATALIHDIDLAGLTFVALTEAGADVNQVLVRQGGAGLGHVFCAKDNFLMMLLAISKGYDINLRNKDGADVYEYSYQSGSLYCGQHLENIMNSLNEQVL